jgi:hypothetical protein
MSIVGGKRKGAQPTNHENVVQPTDYENERDKNVRQNLKRMQELNIPTAQQHNLVQQANRKKKVCIPKYRPKLLLKRESTIL